MQDAHETSESRHLEEHSPYACARAWIALREIHASVAGALASALEGACNLSINEFEVLVHLQACPAGSIPVGELSDVTGLSQPATSRLVTRLERKRFVRRSHSQTDRRSALIELTDSGEALLKKAVAIHASCIREHLLDQLTDAEQELLLTLFARIQTSDRSDSK